jgi:hypothetical protein
MTGPGARPSSPRPRARWRPVAFYAAAACTSAAAAAFFFCVIATYAARWHVTLAKPGIAASAIVMILGAVVLNLTAGDDE